MTLERLKNLRVIDGREMMLEARIEALPVYSPKRKEMLLQLEADIKEREEVYRWIEAISDYRTMDIIALRFVKNAKWDEIAGLIGGISASGCKKIAMRYIHAAEKQEDEIKTTLMLDAVCGMTSNKNNVLRKEVAK